jgi:hypothetical protein
MRRAGFSLLLMAGLAACGTPVAPPVALSPAATTADSDPMRAAIRGAADAFAYPESLDGKPDQAAVAVAQLEFLANEIPAGRTTIELSGIVGPALQTGRREVRQYLGIAPQAPAQAVIDALLATPPNLAQPALFTLGTAETRRRLSDMPRLPQANAATAMARQQMEFGPPEVMIDATP